MSFCPSFLIKGILILSSFDGNEKAGMVKYPKSTKTLVLKQDTAKRFLWELEKRLKEKGYDIEVNAHSFRNTYITKLATPGIPVNLIAEWAGYSKISATMDVYM